MPASLVEIGEAIRKRWSIPEILHEKAPGLPPDRGARHG
jgi:hypothetical protein